MFNLFILALRWNSSGFDRGLAEMQPQIVHVLFNPRALTQAELLLQELPF